LKIQRRSRSSEKGKMLASASVIEAARRTDRSPMPQMPTGFVRSDDISAMRFPPLPYNHNRSPSFTLTR
jgi:hypothetical protein